MYRLNVQPDTDSSISRQEMVWFSLELNQILTLTVSIYYRCVLFLMIDESVFNGF